MSTKIFTEKNGAWTVLERTEPAGLYVVKAYSPAGAVLDKVRCDSRAEALSYLRALRALARNA